MRFSSRRPANSIQNNCYSLMFLIFQLCFPNAGKKKKLCFAFVLHLSFKKRCIFILVHGISAMYIIKTNLIYPVKRAGVAVVTN